MSPPGPRLIEVFGRYLGLDGEAERSAFLDDACRDEPALRGQVEALLRACSDRDWVLDHTAGGGEGGGDGADSGPPPGGTAAGRAAAPPPGPATFAEPAERPGASVGPFKLLQVLGEGGMGTVFLAEQERPIRRKVALKLIRPGMDGGQVIARFEAERQALALMNHPNIARVLEAGTTDSGRPYFVMELVKGVAITEYCDKHHLSTRERLELFLPVCEAIQHAHQKGIIHRDVKPSNVMITLHDGRAQPKVIDFGVAKATEQRLTDLTLFTEFGTVVGTLEYMSPEQFEMGALDVDTRSDVYSLGVLLYELLTGTTPLEKGKLRRQTFSEILRRVREEEPARPSARLAAAAASAALADIAERRRADPARLPELVRGELDWIVMKALEKDRTRRYGSATALALDVRRHLDGDAVEAGPPSATYRARKFASKHRAAIATAGLFAALLVAATALSTTLAVRAARQRSRAEARERTAIDVVEGFVKAIRENPGLTNDPRLAPLRQSLLLQAETFFRELRDQVLADRDTSDESLDRLGQAYMNVGVLTVETGNPAKALPAFELSLAIRRTLAGHDPANDRYARLLALTQWDVGLRYLENDRPDEALALFEEARTILERLVRRDPGSVELRFFLGRTLHSIGLVHETAGRKPGAIAAFERALPIWRGLVRDPAGRIRYGGDLSWSLSRLAALTGDPARFEAAVASYKEAEPVRRRLALERPSDGWVQLDYAFNQSRLAELQDLMGRAEDALATDEDILPTWRKLNEDNPTYTRYRVELANHLQSIGDLRERLRRPGARAAFREAREGRAKLLAENPDSADYALALAATLRRLAAVDGREGRPGDARRLLDEAVGHLRHALDARATHAGLRAALDEAERERSHLDRPGGPPAPTP